MTSKYFIYVYLAFRYFVLFKCIENLLTLGKLQLYSTVSFSLILLMMLIKVRVGAGSETPSWRQRADTAALLTRQMLRHKKTQMGLKMMPFSKVGVFTDL